MPIEEQLEAIFEVLEGGVETTAEVIQFPTDVAGAGATLEGTTSEVMLGNGVATEVSQLTVVEGGVTETAGVGLLAMDVGTAGAAIAPTLGVLAGAGLYFLAPDFWTNVSNRLLEAGQTIGGKVRMYLNGDTKQLGVSEETLEIFKQAFLNAGLFESETSFPEYTNKSGNYTITSAGVSGIELYSMAINKLNEIYGDKLKFDSFYENTLLPALNNWFNARPNHAFGIRIYHVDPNYTNNFESDRGILIIDYGAIGSTFKIANGEFTNPSSKQCFRIRTRGYASAHDFNIVTDTQALTISGVEAWLGEIIDTLYDTYYITSANTSVNYTHGDELQKGAIYPNENPIPKIYPTWTPWSVPVEGFPDVYPIEVPAINPDPDQQQAQFPQEIPDNDPNALDWLIETLPQPDPNPNPYPEPAPNPDPDPQPEPEPIPDPEPEPTPENPVDPNPDPTPSPLPVVPVMPDTVPANAMFTVYAPTISQVNSFGGWLWDSNILEQIKRIWQDPLNGIISFMKVYATPTTGGSDTIKVGVLDSNVSSAVVTSQFVTIDCGSINISEKFYNATDYTPFVSLHLYLPFIGIVELDVDEFMNGTITVTYHVDVYTGTCLAEVKSTRNPDMPNPTIVYTFSGNASQQLPLTSAEFSGALSSLVSAVGGGLAIASGGGLGLLAGATGIAHAVTHEMVHVAHSGSLSANAGIMGSRTPFIIITRHRPYDANGYNTIWGYPSNKTVYLNNCSGLVRVKDMQLKTGATRGENDEIMELLRNGVII